jgi:magnesium-transporting ATPase (P-type)
MIENEASKIIVTGEGVNDVDALNSAQVGIAMCDGVASAKNAAKLVLTNNNFRSVLQSVLWGRNIYQNVTRFLQFQMTVNLSCILVVFIGVFFYSELPMSSAQLLWINLIMDVIAAIALGTEPPMPTLVKGNPRHQTSLLKQKQVWRQIIGISIYNTLVILLLFIFGPNMVAIDEGIPWNGYAKVGLTRPANCSEYPKALLEGQAP